VSSPRLRATSTTVGLGLILCALFAWVEQGSAQSVSPGQVPSSADSLRVAFHRDDGSLTPYTFEHGYSLLTLVYDTLMWRDKDGHPQPWLAQSVDANADFTRFTAKLSDAKWHDGQPVTSSDVAFSFRLFKDRFNARFTPQLDALERVEVLDPTTVLFRLSSSSPGFADLPLSDVPIVPRHLWASLGTRDLPDGLAIGSGPYRLTGYSPGEGYRFETFEGYFRGPPKVRSLEVSIIDTTEMRLQAIERKRIDMTPALFPKTAATRVLDIGTKVIEGPVYAPTMLILNTRVPPFDDVNVRKAASLAVDLGRVESAIGRAEAATKGLIHPESDWVPADEIHRFDLAEARSIFQARQLSRIEILAPTNDLVQLEAGRQVALALKRAGADAELVRTREIDLVNAIGKTGRAPKFSASVWTGLNLGSYEPSFIDAMFGALDFNSPFAFSGFSTPELDELIRRSSSLTSIDERKQAVSQMLTYLNDNAPVIPLAFTNGVYAHRSRFSGWIYIKGSGILDKRSFLEPESKRPASSPETSSPPRESTGVSPIRVIAIAMSLVALGAIAIEIRRRLDLGKQSP
jgi:peptide/nickel transport system substrate-binding protein